jgi:hypothetical protein
VSWLSSIFIGVLAAVLGGAGACLIAVCCVSWYRISSFEGGSGYYVVFVTLGGLVVGLIIGVVCARIVAAGEAATFLRGLGVMSATIASLVVIALGLARLCADLPPQMDGKALELEVEVRCAKNFALPVKSDEYGIHASVYVPRGRNQPTGALRINEASQVDGRWIVSAVVPLDTAASHKLLQVYFSREQNLLFPLSLRGHPGDKDLEWSQWILSGRDAGQAEPAADDNFALRYRVRPVLPPPPGPSAEDTAAKEAAEEQARFEAVAADAPISDWFPYTTYGAPEERRKIAISRIMTRSDYGKELGALMISPDARVAAEALRLVQYFPAPAPQFNAPVAAAGSAIVALIRQVNATPVERDGSYQLAAEASTRFSAWMTAVESLHDKSGGDFTPQLGEILPLARVRTDSHTMRFDILRVASFYMHSWTGLAPLPNDPPPR